MKRERVSLEARLDNLDEKVLQSANSRLHELCSEYDLPFWEVTDKNGSWRELGLRMAGIPARTLKSGGRPKKFSDDALLKMYELYDNLTLFDEYWDQDKYRWVKTFKKSVIGNIAASLKLKDRQINSHLPKAHTIWREKKTLEDEKRNETWDEPGI